MLKERCIGRAVRPLSRVTRVPRCGFIVLGVALSLFLMRGSAQPHHVELSDAALNLRSLPSVPEQLIFPKSLKFLLYLKSYFILPHLSFSFFLNYFQRGDRKPWRKILYERQPYPDNYFDETLFLQGLRRNSALSLISCIFKRPPISSGRAL